MALTSLRRKSMLCTHNTLGRAVAALPTTLPTLVMSRSTAVTPLRTSQPSLRCSVWFKCSLMLYCVVAMSARATPLPVSELTSLAEAPWAASIASEVVTPVMVTPRVITTLSGWAVTLPVPVTVTVGCVVTAPVAGRLATGVEAAPPPLVELAPLLLGAPELPQAARTAPKAATAVRARSRFMAFPLKSTCFRSSRCAAGVPGARVDVPGPRAQSLLPRDGVARCRATGQPDTDRGAHTHPALDRHRPAVRLDDVAHDRKAQAGAARRGAAHEAVEHAGQQVRRDALTVVADGD